MRQVAGSDLARLVQCGEAHAQLHTMLSSAFDGADSESYSSRLDAVTRELIRSLAADALPDQVAKRCTDWLVCELEHFDTKSLLDIVELILGGLKATVARVSSGTIKPHTLLPKCLGLLATIDKCCITLKDGSEVHNGAQVVEHAVRSLVNVPWHASMITGLAETLREVELDKGALARIVTKMLRKLEDVELTQMPALVYQLLLLSDAECKPLVLGELNSHFQRLIDSCARAHEEAHSSQQDMDILPTSLDPEQLQQVQGTAILHIQFAVKQDQALGEAILSLLKTGQMPLGAFSLPLLLSIARVQRFEAQAIACVKEAIKGALTRRSWASTSPWLAQTVAAVPEPSVQQLLLDTVRASGTSGWDHLGQSFVVLCAALLDEKKSGFAKPPSLTAAGAADAGSEAASGSERLPVEVQMVALGREALLEAFRLHSIVRNDVMETIFDRIVTGSDAVLHWVSFLQELVLTQPMMLLDHAQKLKTLLEYLLHLPPSVAAPMLRSLLPLQRQRADLRDHLVLLLRKAMFNREEGMRLTAVHGFLLLLQASAAEAGGAPAASGLGAVGSGGGEANLQFQLELLGFIRRSFTQQASIRTALYEGLVPAFRTQPQLREVILELLLSQLRQFEEEPMDDGPGGAGGAGGAGGSARHGRGTPPLRLDLCMRVVGETPQLIEPLPQLLRAIALCIRCVEDEVLSESDDTVSQAGVRGGGGGGGGGGGAIGDAMAGSQLQSVVRGFSTCALADFQLGGDKVNMTQGDKDKGGVGAYNVATARMLKATLEALLEWCVLCELPSDPSSEPLGVDSDPMSTQTSANSANGGGGNGSALEQTTQVFKLLQSVTELLKEKGPKTKAKTPLPDLDFTLSAEACERVLRAMAASSRGRTAHIIRFVLRATGEQAAGLGAAIEKARSAGAAGASARAEEGRRAVSCAQVLVSLLEPAEHVEGKECVSGDRPKVADVPEKKKGGKKKAAADDDEDDDEKEKAKKRASADGDGRLRSASRLQLALEALEGMVGALTLDPSLELLAAALAPQPAGGAADAMGAGADAAAAAAASDIDERIGVVRGFLTGTLLPLARRLATGNSASEAEVAVRLAAKLAATMPGEQLHETLAWAEDVVANEEVESSRLARQLLGFALQLERRARRDGLAGARRAARQLHDLLGDSMVVDEGGGEALAGHEACTLLTEGNAAHLVAAVLEAANADMADAERAATLLQRAALCASGVVTLPQHPMEAAGSAAGFGVGIGAAGAAGMQTLEQLEGALYERHCMQMEVCRALAQAQYAESTGAHGVMRSCLRQYKLQSALFKEKEKRVKAKADADKERRGGDKEARTMPKELTTMLSQLSGDKGLGAAVYALIAWAGALPAGEQVRGASSAGAVKREARLVPSLIMEMEKLEVTVVKLSKTAGVDLLRYMKKATNRDFRIKNTEVDHALRRKQEEEDGEGEDDEGEEGGKKSKRKKGKEAGGSKAKKPKKGKRDDDTDEDE